MQIYTRKKVEAVVFIGETEGTEAAIQLDSPESATKSIVTSDEKQRLRGLKAINYSRNWAKKNIKAGKCTKIKDAVSGFFINHQKNE